MIETHSDLGLISVVLPIFRWYDLVSRIKHPTPCARRFKDACPFLLCLCLFWCGANMPCCTTGCYCCILDSIRSPDLSEQGGPPASPALQASLHRLYHDGAQQRAIRREDCCREDSRREDSSRSVVGNAVPI